jgi:hypothetical protein
LNYLSHYYFTHKEGDPYYNCGTIFPDWLAAYHRCKFNRELLAVNPEEERITAGIKMHYLADKTFHSSEFFQDATHDIKLILEKGKLDKEKFRFSFLAHLILEMMADRILLKKDPDIGHRFYHDLDLCDAGLLLEFAKRNSSCDENFIQLISGFRQHRFILHYINDLSFIYSLNRITGRVGISFNNEEQEELAKSMILIEDYVNENWKKLLKLFQQ